MGNRVHHLNCGTIRVPGGASVIGVGGPLRRAQGVTHCMLAECDDGLLLVDTGIGTRDCLAPTPFLRTMMAFAGSPRALNETALRQVEALRYAPEDVRHIVVTHFHFDHVGGLPDFPWASVHIYRDEYQAVTQPRGMYERYPYRREHWANGPAWVVHELAGDAWFGFDCTPLVELGGLAFCLVPLPGHSRGLSAVALRLDDGWLLHCGDAYTYHGEVDPDDPRPPPYQHTLRRFMNLNRAVRCIGLHSPRLRALVAAHSDHVRLACSHDPVAFERLRRVSLGATAGKGIGSAVGAVDADP